MVTKLIKQYIMNTNHEFRNQANQIMENFNLDSFIAFNWKLIAAYQNGEITKDDLVSYINQLNALNQTITTGA